MIKLTLSLLAACALGCGANGTALAGGNYVPGVFLLEPTGEPKTYDYAGLNYGPFPSPGTTLNFYRDGKNLGSARLASSADALVGEGIVASFSPEMNVEAGTLVTDREINPDERYAARPATHAEYAELIILNGSLKRPTLPAMPGDTGTRSEVLTIVTDKSGQQNDVAIHTSETRSMDENYEPHLVTRLDIFVRSSHGQWRLEQAEARSGCDGCESQPTSWSLVGFGDVRGTGELALLFTDLGYEAWGLAGYEVSRSGKGGWLVPAGADD